MKYIDVYHKPVFYRFFTFAAAMRTGYPDAPFNGPLQPLHPVREYLYSDNREYNFEYQKLSISNTKISTS